ncbi:hypothetical protein [Yersinia bercovieri]|nr:hypothetical protein [Yersinia bercovieri]CFQ29752.1 Uncharacterised protein [Yersinia bercovieri]
MVQADKGLGENRYQQWIKHADFSAIDDAKRRGAVAEAVRESMLLAVSAD